jgi:serine/threonine protein kinase/TolB-like protein/Flp pilus assembly protein TadD
MALSISQMARMARLLDEALALDETGRRQWLEALAPEHRDLEAALRRALLPDGAEAADADRLGTLPKLEVGGATGAVGTLRPGDRVGPYELVRPIGAGGMAEVWLAQRADGAFKREVALKLPMLTRLRKDLASRFVRERDILARLEHPNIARLYDAGVSAEGLPYLAMEYVRGEPLTGWCDAHCLGVRERLNLFLQILDAVQYAHGHHVIHRDLKPSNILVTESGQVRLLDFGVAKLLAEPDDETQLTQLYGRALTPEYASPELVRGEAIEAASDIYSLGVVLYELLCGSRPYRLKAGASAGLLEQAIATAQVERPSTRIGPEAGSTRGTTPQKLARRLRGDLDAIVLKALAKEPSERYGSASELADELQRYLRGEPVEARPARLSYRFSKFVLRHRTAVPAAAALVLLFAAMGYGLIRHEGLTEPPAPSAGSAASPGLAAAGPVPVPANDKSIAVLPFVDMSEKHDQEYFSDGLSEELIDHLTRAHDLKVIARTSTFSIKGKNEDARTIASKLGVAHLLEGSVRKAGSELRITAQLIRATDGSHLWSQTYERKLADIFKVQDEIAGAVSQSLKVALVANVDGLPPEANLEAYNLVLKGEFIEQRGASGDMEKALELYQAATRLDPNYALAWAKVGDVYQKLGYWSRMPAEEARIKAMDAIQHALRIAPNHGRSYNTQGKIYRDFDWNWKDARKAFNKAIELDPSDMFPRVNRGYLTWMQTGNIDEGIDALQQLLTRNPLDLTSQSVLAFDYYAAGRYAESSRMFEKALELSPGRRGARGYYGRSLLMAGRNAEALNAVEAEPDEGVKLPILTCVYWALGRRAESDAALLRLQKSAASLSPSDVAFGHSCRGESEAAFEWLDRAYRQHDTQMPNIKFAPEYRGLRNDPRFQALLVKMKFSDDPSTSIR